MSKNNIKYNHLKLNQLIRTAQKIKKMTLPEIGEAVGLSGPAVQRLNAGTNVPSIESLIAFAQYFNVDMNYFFDFEDTGVVSEPTVEYKKKESEEVAFLKKQLEQANDLIDMFKRGDIRVEHPKKDDIGKCG